MYESWGCLGFICSRCWGCEVDVDMNEKTFFEGYKLDCAVYIDRRGMVPGNLCANYPEVLVLKLSRVLEGSALDSCTT